MLQAPDFESLSTPGYVAVPEEYLAECLDVHRRVMAGESVVWTYEVIGLRGRRRHVEAHAVPFRLPDGAKAHMCISRDVNERQEAHEALRRSEERLRLVQEPMPTDERTSRRISSSKWGCRKMAPRC